jgi:hypothetical protein
MHMSSGSELLYFHYLDSESGSCNEIVKKWSTFHVWLHPTTMKESIYSGPHVVGLDGSCEPVGLFLHVIDFEQIEV